MTFPDITADLKARMPELRGRLSANAPLAEAGVGRDRPCEARLLHDRRNDVERGQAARHTTNVIPAKAGTHASLHAHDARDRAEEIR